MSDVQAEQQAEQQPAADAAPASSEPVQAAPAETSTVEQAAVAAHPAENALQRIEDLAILWGGEVWTEVRNLVGEIRSVL